MSLARIPLALTVVAVVCTAFTITTQSRTRIQHRLALQASALESNHNAQNDVVIIGSGLGGLCCGAVLATAGYKVTLCEAHYEIGGCAHEFMIKQDGTSLPSDRLADGQIPNDVYKFEAGPSLYSGLSQDASPNPLKNVFQMIGENPEWVTYDIWAGFFPESPEGFRQSIGAKAFEETLKQYGGPTAMEDWEKLAKALRPVAAGIMDFPSVALRSDFGALLTTIGRYPGPVFKTLQQVRMLTRPFSEFYEELDIKDEFLKNYLNLLCFLLQGLPAEGTLSAVMAYMIDDFFKQDAVVDFPMGGSGAIASALERGITKNGGKVLRRAHVEEVLVEEGRATGVKLRSKTEGGDNIVIKADKAVVSNCDLWTTFKLVPEGKHEGFDEERKELKKNVPLCKSFVHLHVGLDGKDLPDDLPPQWTICADWNCPIDDPSNVIVVSMPSLLDPSLAPEGQHVIHAYTAGNEPYEFWEDFEKGGDKAAYEKYKEERAKCLWDAIEKVIPDARQRAKVTLVGSPLTHERFNRRFRGTYGPAIIAGTQTFPGPRTPIPGLLRCGDSVNPGIGVPAVASSGMNAAAAVLTVKEHNKLLDRIRIK